MDLSLKCFFYLLFLVSLFVGMIVATNYGYDLLFNVALLYTLGNIAYFSLYSMCQWFSDESFCYRVSKYDDGFFYVETMSYIIPFLWHNEVYVRKDGTLTLDSDFARARSSKQSITQEYIRDNIARNNINAKANKRLYVCKKDNNKTELGQLQMKAGVLFCDGKEEEAKEVLELIEKLELNK